MLNAAIISAIEDFAPALFQESWDNTGVQVRSLRAQCSGVLLCVDVTPAIVDEARDKGCNLIISHHPLIFKGLKRLTGNTPVEEAVMRAIAYGITVYSCHTSVDSTPGGVSYRMAKMLGARPVRVLSPLEGRRVRVRAIVKIEACETTLAVLADTVPGQQCFVSDTDAKISVTDPQDPFGTTQVSSMSCKSVEAICPNESSGLIKSRLDEAIGDGLVAFVTEAIKDTDPTIGLGVFALLDDAVSPMELVERVKSTFSSPVARCTALPPEETRITRIAMCGGSGSEFIGAAMRQGAQAFITSDTRYHDFADYRNEILIIDIGHFESESCTKEIFYNVIREKFPNFACYYSEIEENPIKYI